MVTAIIMKAIMITSRHRSVWSSHWLLRRLARTPMREADDRWGAYKQNSADPTSWVWNKLPHRCYAIQSNPMQCIQTFSSSSSSASPLVWFVVEDLFSSFECWDGEMMRFMEWNNSHPVEIWFRISALGFLFFALSHAEIFKISQIIPSSVMILAQIARLSSDPNRQSLCVCVSSCSRMILFILWNESHDLLCRLISYDKNLLHSHNNRRTENITLTARNIQVSTCIQVTFSV